MNPSRQPERLIWWLMLVVASGITAVLPVLPLYAKEMNADMGFIGLMMGAFWAANLIGLPIGGWLSDRFGRRWLMLIGLVTFGLGSAGFLVVTDVPWFVLLRGLEGLGAACFFPAAMAYLADRGESGTQGSRMADLAAAENIGILIGPLLGGAIASLWGLGAPFACLALFTLSGTLLVVGLPETKHRAMAPSIQEEQEDWRKVDWALVGGMACRYVAVGFSMGLAEVIWPIFMTDLGGSLWQISLSWTLFALPSILLARYVGSLIDRIGAGRPAVYGAALFVGVTLFYPLLQAPWAVIGLSMVEGIGFAFAYPAQNTLLVLTGPRGVRGRLIGWVSTVRTAFAVVGAMSTPWLYAISPFWCFGVAAAVHLVGAGGLAIALMKRKS